jgi:hypothetical protein
MLHAGNEFAYILSMPWDSEWIQIKGNGLINPLEEISRLSNIQAIIGHCCLLLAKIMVRVRNKN